MSAARPQHPVRIPPVGDPDPEQAEILAKAPLRPDGSVRNIFSTLAHHPLLLKRFNAFAGTFMRFGKVSAYERELIVIRVAGRIGSRYELAQHLEIARQAGLGDEQIRAALLQPGAAPLSDSDRLLVEFTDELLATGDLADATWEALAARYEEDALLELLFTVGLYRMVGDVLNTVGVEVEEEPDLELDLAPVQCPGSGTTPDS